MNGFMAKLVSLLFFISIVSGCAHMGTESEPQPPPSTTATAPSPKPQPPPSTVETAPSSEPEIRRAMVTVTASRLNLRAEKTTKSKILSVLNKDESLSVLGREGGWVNVQTESGKKGWVAERYTRPVKPMTTQAAEAKISPGASPKTILPEEIPSSTGQVQGELVINGVSSPLKYAYAYTEPDFLDKSKMDTVVILSNMILDDEEMNDWGRRAYLEKAGKLHCVELTINSDGKVISRRLRHSAFKAGPSSVSSDEVFEPHAAGKGVIAGKAYTTKEDDFFGVTYQYRASFKAQIRPPAQMSAEEKAPEEEKTPSNVSKAKKDKWGTLAVGLKFSGFLASQEEQLVLANTGDGSNETYIFSDRYLQAGVQVSYFPIRWLSINLGLDKAFMTDLELIQLSLDVGYHFKEIGHFAPYVNAGLVYGDLNWSAFPGGFEPGIGWKLGLGCLYPLWKLQVGVEAAYQGIAYSLDIPSDVSILAGDDNIDQSGIMVSVLVRYPF